ncbi:Hypothetical protein FKW44_011932, partial [Caligus rogercresseyi]
GLTLNDILDLLEDETQDCDVIIEPPEVTELTDCDSDGDDPDNATADTSVLS